MYEDKNTAVSVTELANFPSQAVRPNRSYLGIHDVEISSFQWWYASGPSGATYKDGAISTKKWKAMIYKACMTQCVEYSASVIIVQVVDSKGNSESKDQGRAAWVPGLANKDSKEAELKRVHG